jgi:hypothetical protein
MSNAAGRSAGSHADPDAADGTYLLKSHLGPFLFALFALTGILFVNTIARRFEDLAGKGLPAQRDPRGLRTLAAAHPGADAADGGARRGALRVLAARGDNEITALKAAAST